MIVTATKGDRTKTGMVSVLFPGGGVWGEPAWRTSVKLESRTEGGPPTWRQTGREPSGHGDGNPLGHTRLMDLSHCKKNCPGGTGAVNEGDGTALRDCYLRR